MQITPEQQQRLHALTDIFLEENANINLSAFRTPEACWNGNVLDSLAALDLEEVQNLVKNANSPTPNPSPEGGGEPELEYKKSGSLPRNTLSYARNMRGNPTEAEEVLWEGIRDNQLGAHFRRQHIVDGFILDFYCNSAKLGIEIDGAIHENTKQTKLDEERSKHLLDKFGIRVIRFNNSDTLENTASIINQIRAELPSPSGGRAGDGGTKLPSPYGGRAGDGDKPKILDIGTGGGFPLLPLAICLPEISFTGLDATQKKIDAIKRIAEKLELKNVNFVCGRSEELGKQDEFREQYDIVTARALAPLNVLIEYAAPFVRQKGHIIAWKSMTIDQELKDSLLARAELSSHLKRHYEYELPSDFGKRQLLIFDKTSKTSSKYPRDIGIPKKTPLL